MNNNLEAFAGRQLRDCKALLLSIDYTDKEEILGLIQTTLNNRDTAQPGDAGLCPDCGRQITKNFCDACLWRPCGGQQKRGWREIQRFGRVS
jgi:hypothetical protein